MRKKEFTNKWISQKLGALPSPFDYRNLEYMKFTDPFMAASLPKEYTGLEEYLPDNFARSQGNIGSCVGWDGSFVYETQLTLLAKYLQQALVATGNYTYIDRFEKSRTLRLALQDFSAGWAYLLSRKYSIPPVPDWVEGSTNFGLMKALEAMGICPEALCPTDIVAPWDKPQITTEKIQAAEQYKIASYHNIPPDPESVKAAMYGLLHELPYKMPDGSEGKTPLISAFPVYSSFKDAYDDGIVPMPKPGERLLGGHSSMLSAWRIIDDGEYFDNFGSWGTDIGDNGVFYIPRDYPFYKNDFWLIKILPTAEPPTPTCIWENENWITRLLNWMDSSKLEYYYGVPVGGDN